MVWRRLFYSNSDLFEINDGERNLKNILSTLYLLTTTLMIYLGKITKIITIDINNEYVIVS